MSPFFMYGNRYMDSLPNIIDIEASGFGRGSYPIEVGYILANGDTFCSLILPADDWKKWDVSAEQIHGVTREILSQAGQPLNHIAETLNHQLSGKTLYSDAWGNDASWLGKLFDEANLPMRYRLDSIRALLTENQAACWHQTKGEVLESTPLKRHRASSDAAILQKTFALIQSRYQQAS